MDIGYIRKFYESYGQSRQLGKSAKATLINKIRAQFLPIDMGNLQAIWANNKL